MTAVEPKPNMASVDAHQIPEIVKTQKCTIQRLNSISTRGLKMRLPRKKRTRQVDSGRSRFLQRENRPRNVRGSIRQIYPKSRDAKNVVGNKRCPIVSHVAQKLHGDSFWQFGVHSRFDETKASITHLIPYIVPIHPTFQIQTCQFHVRFDPSQTLTFFSTRHLLICA